MVFGAQVALALGEALSFDDPQWSADGSGSTVFAFGAVFSSRQEGENTGRRFRPTPIFAANQKNRKGNGSSRRTILRSLVLRTRTASAFW